jgi:hypothetical protein
MLEIAESNGKTSNNNIRLVAATLAISVARLAATAFAVLVIATPFKLTTLAVPIIATPLKCNAYKAIRSRAASGAS